MLTISIGKTGKLLSYPYHLFNSFFIYFRYNPQNYTQIWLGAPPYSLILENNIHIEDSMTSTLLISQIVLALAITIAVLLQKSSSIGLGAYSGSNESMFGAKGPMGFLAKGTFALALLFVLNTLMLGYFYTKENTRSVAETIASSVPVSPEAKKIIAPSAPTAPVSTTAPVEEKAAPATTTAPVAEKEAPAGTVATVATESKTIPQSPATSVVPETSEVPKPATH